MIKRLVQPVFILVLILLVIILITRECRGPKTQAVKADTVTTEKVIVELDTIVRTKIVQKIVPYETIDCLYYDVDTGAILADYNRVRVYRRLLWSDSMADITLTDTVFRNQLQGAKIKAFFFTHDTTRIITRIINTLPPPPRNKVFIGFQTGMIIPTNKIIITPTLTLNTRRDHLYSIGYDPFNKSAYVGLGWKIKLRLHQRDVD